jgi:ATP-binding cassette subfamily B protein
MFYNHLQRLSYAFHDHSQTGQLMSRATADVEEVRMFVGFALLRGVYFLVLMVVITVLLLLLDGKLAIMSLSVLPFISYRTVAINRRLRILWAKVQQNLGVLGTIIQENLTGTKVVRAFAREDFENQKFHRQAEIICNQEIEANNLLASNSPVMSFALLLAMAAILWYGGRQVITGSLSQVTWCNFTLPNAQHASEDAGMADHPLFQSNGVRKRIYEILDQVSCKIVRRQRYGQIRRRIVFEKVSSVMMRRIYSKEHQFSPDRADSRPGGRQRQRQNDTGQSHPAFL